MLNDHVQRFYVLLTLGIVTILLGLVNFVLIRFSVRTRILVGMATYSAALAGVGSILPDPFTLTAALVLGILAFLVFIDGRWQLLSRPFQSPRRVSIAVAALGIILTAGSTFLYSWEEEAYFSQLEEEFEVFMESASTEPAPDVVASTDRGRPLVLRTVISRRPADRLQFLGELSLQNQKLVNRVIMHEPSNEISNCHGWVFTGGRYWVSGNDVDSILSDNGYVQVEQPRPGDLVIYRRDGVVAHTAIVRYVTEGRPVMVEGKWGAHGVFLHEVDQSCYRFGHTYYTTSRPTHLIREFVKFSELPLPEGSLGLEGLDSTK